MRTEHDSFAILDAALNAAGAAEADAVFISVDQNISRFANSNLHQNMSEVSAELTLRVIVDDAMGVASTTVFDADEIARTAALAREAARHSDPLQNFSGLYRQSEPLPSVHTFDEATAAIPPADKARALREMFDRGRKFKIEFAGAYGTGSSSTAVANTHGVRRYCTMTSSDASVIAIGANGSGYATGIDRRNLDVVALGDEATSKAILCDGTIEEIEPGPYDVILEPPATAEVADWMNLITLSGSCIDDGSSFFVGNIGKQILGANFTLADDALDETFLPFPFDLEGLPKRRVALIERGVVRTPAVDKAYADRLGVAPTATCWNLGGTEHGSAFHLAIDGGDATREELIRSTRRGIWVTRFNYVNGLLEPKTALMTGTTRDGTFLIRDGEVVARLPNLRWTQSIVEAFSRIEGLTRERRRVATWYNHFGGTIAPVMKIAGWNFGGVAQIEKG
ncbi:MAG TPA: metallopeptidase TldD-related protein [Thermoanaerobaculia bacterium]|nr:metallopeptidase TldD-related protein [Thermoanaerobaculia bacterium]